MKHKLACLFLILALAGCARKNEESPKPVVEVKTATVEQADLDVVVHGPATVFPIAQANLASRLTAPLRELLVGKGDTVSRGQVLARLEKTDLLAQHAEAAAAVTDAEATLEKTVNGTLPTDIERARGQAAMAAASLQQAQKFYDRRKQLYEQGAIPQRDLLVSETDLSLAKTNFEVARKSLQLLEGQSKASDIQIARSRVEQSKGRLGNIAAQLQFTEIRAPFAGTLIEQFVFPGDMAKPDAPVFTLADLSTAVARAQVPEAEAAALRRGQPCSLAPSDDPEASYGGKLTVVNQAVDPARRTVEAWCEIPNAKRPLRAGIFGTLTIVTGRLTKSLAVPLKAVQFEEGTRKGFVMVVAGGRAAKRAVETGPRVGDRVPVHSGVKAGETVIVEGGYGVPDGTEVKTARGSKE